MAFVDLEKAFDRVPRKVIWWALRKLGVEEWTVRLVQGMYANARSQVRVDDGYSEEFEVKVGVHQGSVLSPLLFIVVLEALSREFRSGVPWEDLYADDLVIIGSHLRNVPQSEVHVGSDKLDVVASFCYLGDMLSAAGGCDLATTTRVKTAWKKFKELLPVLLSRHLSYKTRGHVYSTCVRSAMLHASETWPLTKPNLQRLQRNDRAMIRQICNVKPEDVATTRSNELLTLLGLEDLNLILKERRLRWYGHVERSSGAIKTALDMQVTGSRGKGRPRMTWKQVTERDRKDWKLSTTDPHDRNTWRSGVRSAMRAASQLPGRGSTDVDVAPVPAC
ncbi:hypothetical protein EGW08_006098 [Elysia chlorotica]|uniref:Reverse transcriptase domain-containing protein n=1 Tax=Elysia chlorotica TaxID=188477 RepID=A0A433TX30_ELYCH|nr:hypothetical protein EGW08_006098 [Elysia chlorotica]